MAVARRYASLVREDVILRSETMGQPGFFDAEKRLAALSKKGDPLETIAALVPWESFRADIEAVALTPDAEKKSRAGLSPGRSPMTASRTMTVFLMRSAADADWPAIS